MSYILIESNDDLTSQERAELITRELYNITAPEAIQHDYQADGTVFGLVKHPDSDDWAMHIQEDWVNLLPRRRGPRLASWVPSLKCPPTR